MSYIAELRRTALSSLVSAAGTAVTTLFSAIALVGRAIARRRLIAELGEFDDKMLRDIGLTRADLRDASAGPFWQDPTNVLVVRSVERRASRRHAARFMRQMTEVTPAETTEVRAPETTVVH